MTKFNVGAGRQANDDARGMQFAAANALVQRTLAQHGLIPGAIAGQDAPAASGLPNMDSLLAAFRDPRGTPREEMLLPEGAVFRNGQFTDTAGARAFRTYVPSTATRGVTGIVVMLHGCTQTAEDFAVGTGMNALAEEHRLVVIYPQQSRGDNAQSCWNWFSRGDQRRGRGEPSIIAGITREVMTEFGVPPERTFVAGLSAGAAMAVIMGETYPDVFAAVGAHSGLPFGSAKDVTSAFAAMRGTEQEASAPVQPGKAVRSIVFHGSADATVHPSNGGRIVRDIVDRTAGQTLETELQGNASGRRYTRQITTDTDGSVRLEHWVVEGLGHAWSGGQPGGSYTDPAGPDASAEMIRFFFDKQDRKV